jgi:quercetin dioxygenase-like cupin family protein
MVIQGSVIFRVGDEVQTIQPGGIWRIPPETPHTVTGGRLGGFCEIRSPSRHAT